MTRAEMLKDVGMPADRFETYLSLLKSVGAYRVARMGDGKGVRMLPNRAGTSARLVYDATGGNAGRSSSLGDHWFLEME